MPFIACDQPIVFRSMLKRHVPEQQVNPQSKSLNISHFFVSKNLAEIFCDAGAHPPSLRLLRLLRAGQDGPELGRGHHGEGGHDHVIHC